MSESVGRSLGMPLVRRAIGDFLHVSMKVPTVTVQKDMHLAEVVACRSRLRKRPSWCGIFTKAYAKVVASRPDLRRVVLSFPWERQFEYTNATADIVMETKLGNDIGLAFVPIKQPELSSLLDIDARLAWCGEKPVERIRSFQRGLWLAHWPRAVRRAVWWYILNVSGHKRSRYFGTFGVTSVGNWGVESVRPLAPWTSLLHYGTIDSSGKISMRLTYDHRVLDGSGPSTALNEMEQFLRTEIVAELQSLDDIGLKAAS